MLKLGPPFKWLRGRGPGDDKSWSAFLNGVGLHFLMTKSYQSACIADLIESNAERGSHCQHFWVLS